MMMLLAYTNAAVLGLDWFVNTWPGRIAAVVLVLWWAGVPRKLRDRAPWCPWCRTRHVPGTTGCEEGY